MADRKTKPPYFVCETCGRHTTRLRRDVLDAHYNALGKTPLWNCDECYQIKRQARLARAAHEHDRSSS